MKKSKIKITVMIISLLLFVATIGLTISMSKIDKQTEDTTTLYTATVTDVNITNTQKNIFIEINTKEYNTALHISTNISKNIEIEDVKKLKNGQTIFFRIENTQVHQINEIEFVNITSLKTNTKDILSLEEYNKCIYNAARPARIASIVMASLFLSISMFCYLKIIKRKTGDGSVC